LTRILDVNGEGLINKEMLDKSSPKSFTKINTNGGMKNRLTQMKFTDVSDREDQAKWVNNWISGGKNSYWNQSPIEKRPFTDSNEYKRIYHIQNRAFGSRSQERTYQDRKKLSKLLKKAGAGRFSQNIPNIIEKELSGDLYSWGISQDGVLGHEIKEDEENEDLKSDEKGYLFCK